MPSFHSGEINEDEQTTFSKAVATAVAENWKVSIFDSLKPRLTLIGGLGHEWWRQPIVRTSVSVRTIVVTRILPSRMRERTRSYISGTTPALRKATSCFEMALHCHFGGQIKRPRHVRNKWHLSYIKDLFQGHALLLIFSRMFAGYCFAILYIFLNTSALKLFQKVINRFSGCPSIKWRWIFSHEFWSFVVTIHQFLCIRRCKKALKAYL